LRAGILAQCAPLADDVVISGENRDELVALFFPAASSREDPGIVAQLSARIGTWNATNGGSSTRIARFDIATSPADRTKGELSDKGQIVRSRYLRNHAPLFETLRGGGGYQPAT
ncbi:hypothetical protein AB4144_52445, partial [Rhizobiaceae sp. 2RAB30]